MKKIVLLFTAVILAVVIFTACKGTVSEHPFVAGILDSPLPADSAPAQVLEALEKAERLHQYKIMSDTANNISVEAIAEADMTPTEGYGIVVVKGATSTTFPHIRNARAPMASYDQETGILWLTCSVMEGTGIAVERLYQICFDKEDKAYIAHHRTIRHTASFAEAIGLLHRRPANNALRRRKLHRNCREHHY